MQEKQTKTNNTSYEKAIADHSRLFESFTYVYPVISRRAGGFSIGVNLNIDKNCNFDCVYCQVDRTVPMDKIPVDVEKIKSELIDLIEMHKQGYLQQHPRFKDVDPEFKNLKDISISGDGEPTMIPEFQDVCEMVNSIQKEYEELDLKLILISNATLFHLKKVKAGLGLLTERNGEIWGKLDAGSEAWFQTIDQSKFNLDHIEKNLKDCLATFPMKIQTMLCTFEGQQPGDDELSQLQSRILNVYNSNPENFRELQLYSVVRDPAYPSCHPLSKEFLLSFKERILAQQEVPVSCF